MAPNLTAHCESALPCTWVFGVRGQEACRMLTPLPPLQVSHRRRRGFCFLEQPKSHQRAQQRRAALDLHQAALRPADRAPPGLVQRIPHTLVPCQIFWGTDKTRVHSSGLQVVFCHSCCSWSFFRFSVCYYAVPLLLQNVFVISNSCALHFCFVFISA